MVAEPNDANLTDQDWGIPRSALSVRIPSWAHKRMKTEAREAGVTVADLYAAVIERFLDDEIQHWSKALLTGPTSSPSTTLAMARPLVLRVRAIADERDVLISALVYTAVLLHLDEAPRAVAAA
ncbi:hypothetical protein [Brevundimonas naejangsanensis]|uniref:hypothetical protein n=1 Tax=Brevundimonas naejangsanensis TaxID=588932 RepID=UPI003208FB39